MPDRILRERVTTSPELDRVSADAERLFFRQMVRCDDYGNFEAAPALLLATCFPRRAGEWPLDQLGAWRDELAAAGLWDLYEVHGRLYGTFRTWGKHQRQRDSRPKYPKRDHHAAQPWPAAVRGDVQPNARARDCRESRVESRESRSNLSPIEAEAEAPPATSDGRELQAAETSRVDVKALVHQVTSMLSAPAANGARSRRAGADAP